MIPLRRSVSRLAVAAIVTVTAVTTIPRSARAQERDPTTAEALFFAGREAMERGDFAEACPKFAESDRLDPGAGTRINLADCEERLQHPAAAWRHWREALELLPTNDERRPLVQDRIKQLEPVLPRLTLRLVSPVKGARIERDGIEVGLVSLGLPLPVEPGEHTIHVTAPDHEPSTVTVVLAVGERKTLAVEPGAATTLASVPAPPPPPPSTSALRPIGFGSAVGGSVALAAGLVFGALALSAKSDLEGNCFPSTVCNDDGADAASRGRTFAALSTATVIVGGALLAGGIALVLTHPKARTTVIGSASSGGADVLGVRF